MRKAQMTFLKSAGLMIILSAITLSIGQQILNGFDSDIACTTSYEYNATMDGEAGIDEISSWLPTVGLTIAAAVILGIVGTYVAKK